MAFEGENLFREVAQKKTRERRRKKNNVWLTSKVIVLISPSESTHKNIFDFAMRSVKNDAS